MKKILFSLISFLFSYQFVLAETGSPIINVTDTDFGDVTVGQRAKREIVISNTGSAELYITGFSGPFDSSFVQTGLPTMSLSNPLKLLLNASFKFNVSFTPSEENTYSDKIIFSSNARIIDSTALLLGRGVKAHLNANGFDWGRRRIDRPGTFNISPYPYDGPIEQTPIHLYNNGTQEVIIYNIIIETNIIGNAFEFDRSKLIHLTIPAKGDILLPVQFHPTQTGKHELTFTYNNSAGSNAKTSLKGIGILPKIATNDAYFDSTVIMDYNNPSIPDQKIYFTNKPWTDADGTDVSDSLTLDFKIGPKGNEISTDGINWGTEGFRFDKAKIKHSVLGDNLAFPVVLHQTESVEIVGAQFVAQHSGGLHEGTISSVSDAYGDVVSTWTGRGIDPTSVEDYSNEENIGRLLGYFDILGRRINSIEQYHGLFLEIRMEKNKVLKKIVYKD